MLCLEEMGARYSVRPVCMYVCICRFESLCLVFNVQYSMFNSLSAIPNKPIVANTFPVQ